jgi:hypothetical protein
MVTLGGEKPRTLDEMCIPAANTPRHTAHVK